MLYTSSVYILQLCNTFELRIKFQNFLKRDCRNDTNQLSVLIAKKVAWILFSSKLLSLPCLIILHENQILYSSQYSRLTGIQRLSKRAKNSFSSKKKELSTFLKREKKIVSTSAVEKVLLTMILQKMIVK